MGLSSVGTVALGEERQHMGMANMKSAGSHPSPASVPAAQGPQRQGRDCSQGRGQGGKGDFIQVEYICLAEIS